VTKTVRIVAERCTGCALCVHVWPPLRSGFATGTQTKPGLTALRRVRRPGPRPLPTVLAHWVRTDIVNSCSS
jgi:Fe-S-cluster-containing hydrogenase component 2